jgi:hypothetical protein
LRCRFFLGEAEKEDTLISCVMPEKKRTRLRRQGVCDRKEAESKLVCPEFRVGRWSPD